MTQPPHSAGGAGAPSTSVPSTDFGAPTVSGTPRSGDGSAAAAFLAASQRLRRILDAQIR